MAEHPALRLFHKSYLKQTKYHQIIRVLGPVGERHILEVGSDNGVFSWLFRRQGGTWKSADIDERSLSAMRELVETDVYRLVDGRPMPFADNEFDCVILVDILEHLKDDSGFIKEVYRVLKPGGPLIVNAPTFREGSLLMRFRRLLGLTDADHGHLRPGYRQADLKNLLGDMFKLETWRTHTGFFAKLMDTMLVLAVSTLKQNRTEKTPGRGVLVTGSDMHSHRMMFGVYQLVYPFVRLVSSLDHLFFCRRGYMFIAAGHSTKTEGEENTTRYR